MVATIRQYKAAAVNAEPGWLNLELSIEKTIHWINEAGEAGCKLIAFPELWIPGYPYWIWRTDYRESLPLIKKYRQNSLPSNSLGMHRIRAAAKRNAIFVSLGYSEVDLNSLYISQVLIDPTGTVLNHRRKIRATHLECLIFGDGGVDTTSMVVDTEIGRIGQLICWENMNPFLKAYAVNLGEEIHVAAWPLYPHASSLPYPDPYSNVSEASADVVTPAYAIETGTFTLASFQAISAEGVERQTPPGKEPEDHLMYNGNTRVYGPDGQALTPKPADDFDGLVLVDIDLDETQLSKAANDFGGQYSRPDLIRLVVEKDRRVALSPGYEPESRENVSTMERVGLTKPVHEDVLAEAEGSAGKRTCCDGETVAPAQGAEDAEDTESAEDAEAEEGAEATENAAAVGDAEPVKPDEAADDTGNGTEPFEAAEAANGDAEAAEAAEATEDVEDPDAKAAEDAEAAEGADDAEDEATPEPAE